jgi:hypothetical protein
LQSLKNDVTAALIEPAGEVALGARDEIRVPTATRAARFHHAARRPCSLSEGVAELSVAPMPFLVKAAF